MANRSPDYTYDMPSLGQLDTPKASSVPGYDENCPDWKVPVTINGQDTLDMVVLSQVT